MNEQPLPEWHSELRDQVSALKADVADVKGDLAANTEATEQVRRSMSGIEANTAELMQWLRAFQGAMRLLDLLGRVAKPLGYIAMAIGAVASAWYAFIHKGP